MSLSIYQKVKSHSTTDMNLDPTFFDYNGGRFEGDQLEIQTGSGGHRAGKRGTWGPWRRWVTVGARRCCSGTRL